MASDHAAVDRAVADQGPWIERLLDELVSAATLLGDEESGQTIMSRAFTDCGLEPVDVPMDHVALRADPHHSPFSWDVSGKRNVLATWHGTGGGRSLVLNGHIDVVPPASPSLWAGDPFVPRRAGDVLYGRGAGDMKAGLAAMTGAVRALRKLGVPLAGDVQLQSVVEEECTGNGTLQCLLSPDGLRADAAVVTEPHFDHITVAQVGVLWFHVDVRGKPAHAGRAAERGRNAFEAALAVLGALRDLERELNDERDRHPAYRDHPHPINLNPGVVTAGDWTSTVPAECTLSCRLALYPGQQPAELQARVEAAVARAQDTDPFLASHPPMVRYDGFACEGCSVPPDAPLVRAFAEVYAGALGSAPDLRAITSTTDARHFVRHGIPAICFGPDAPDIHCVDEGVSISSVHETARVLARFIVSWCGVGPVGRHG